MADDDSDDTIKVGVCNLPTLSLSSVTKSLDQNGN